MDYRRDTEIQQAQTRDRKRRKKTHALQAQAGDSADTHILQTQLKQYAERGLYPFHMPGHKRLMQPAPDLPAGWDVTEVPGTDDLHDADGILLQAMRRTARLCGADRTWYLVNGSTCGLLAGIRALAPMGAEVICARNCHKAVYHAIELSGYRVHWIMPPVDEEWGICGGISAGQISSAIRRHPSAKAVILTSPTYEGVLSEIAGICEICHKRGIPVLVDEAHGAHLIPASVSAGFPAGALAAGADLTVQSPHKTLPSLTQTALLHLRGHLVDPERVEQELDIFETSSPSYLLMASLDGCTGILRESGEELFGNWADRIGRFDALVREKLKRIRILGRTEPSFSSGPCDPGKILIDASPLGMKGTRMASILRDQYRMETEMAQGGLVLVMTSICDEEDALDRLARALIEVESSAGSKTEADQEPCASSPKSYIPQLSDLRPTAACTISEAAGQESETVPLSLARGRVCAEYLYFYPPGIPVAAPGEIITGKLAALLEQARRDGALLYRHSEDRTAIRCLRE